jgi:hypothetical protein
MPATLLPTKLLDHLPLPFRTLRLGAAVREATTTRTLTWFQGRGVFVTLGDTETETSHVA